MTTAIVLSLDTMGLAVVRSLGVHGVPITAVYYNARDMGYVSKYVTESVFAPHPERQEQQFIDLLIALVSKHANSLLIPTDDATLIAVSRHKLVLEQHCVVACADWKITRQIIDKKSTYLLAHSVGVATPQTWLSGSEDDMRHWSREVGYPIVVKPRQSHLYAEHFGKKCAQAADFDELLVAYEQATNAGIDVILQEFIPGRDAQNINYNSYHRDGEPLVEFTAKKVRLSPPFFGLPRVVVSAVVPDVIEPARQFLRALGFSGYCCAEFKRDPRDGICKLMEVNGRHNRSGLLAMRCGIDFPWLEYQFLLHKVIPGSCTFVEGIYWIDEFRDAFDWIRYRSQEKHSPGEYLRPYRQNHVFSSFDLSDTKPFFKRLLNGLVKKSQHAK